MIQTDGKRKKTLSQVRLERTYELMTKRRVKGFYNYITSDSLRAGSLSLLQTTGLGKLRPNLLLLGFKANWQLSSPKQVTDYVNIIQ